MDGKLTKMKLNTIHERVSRAGAEGDINDLLDVARSDAPRLLDHIAKLQGKIDLYESYAQEYDYYAILNEMGDEDDNV